MLGNVKNLPPATDRENQIHSAMEGDAIVVRAGPPLSAEPGVEIFRLNLPRKAIEAMREHEILFLSESFGRVIRQARDTGHAQAQDAVKAALGLHRG